MADFCAFCGSEGPLTREHVFGQWVSRSGLDLAPVRHFAGPLNALPRDMGEQPPYRQTVKSVCAACNNGWMSDLEAVAQRVLVPFIRGEAGAIAVEDQAAIATWVQKTALTAMLLSSKEQRDSGYGLDPAEYEALYARRELLQPLDDSHYWVGRFNGSDGFSAVRVTPLTLRFPGLPEPPLPQGYAMTVVLGGVVFHGVRFVIPGLKADPATELQMPQLWPSRAATEWPAGQAWTRQSFLSLADGGTLRAMHGRVRLQPWSHAAHLPESEFEDGLIKVPALCRKHEVYYPAELVEEAFRGRFYAFMTSCECSAYLIRTDSDRVRFRGAGDAEGVAAMYADLPGRDIVIRDGRGEFHCKRLPPD